MTKELKLTKNATVYVQGDKQFLYSYGTLVLVETPEGFYRANRKNCLVTSPTTVMHVRKFSGMNKAEYIALPEWELRNKAV